MATVYAYPNHTEWKLAGVGPCDIQVQGPETLIHIGPTLPLTYEGADHKHLNKEDPVYYYAGAQNVYVRVMNDNNAGIVALGKVALTEV